MAWGTDKNSGGKHGGKKDPGTSKPSPDGARPAPEPKHKKEDGKK
ncbi:hypothetical protein [Kitasatospora sp. A2-31]|nr:hypothetical protein [Kitasatospora sp. A2-31]